MPRHPKSTRPPFLAKAFAEPYASLARSNVGSFLDAYLKKHEKYHEPRAMLPAFLHYLGRKREELKDLAASDIDLKDKTTRGMYDILKTRADSRKKKPPP